MWDYSFLYLENSEVGSLAVIRLQWEERPAGWGGEREAQESARCSSRAIKRPTEDGFPAFSSWRLLPSRSLWLTRAPELSWQGLALKEGEVTGFFWQV